MNARVYCLSGKDLHTMLLNVFAYSAIEMRYINTQSPTIIFTDFILSFLEKSTHVGHDLTLVVHR